jgi:uncharacterized protein with PQ loop repeat
MSPTVTSIVALHGYLAPLASIGCFLAPYATIRVVAAEKRVRSLPLLPYSSMIISSFLWTTYGLLVREPKIWASNMVGVTCAMYYAHVFTQYCPAAASTLPGSVRAHIRGILAIVIATLVIAIVAPINVATYVIGKAGVVFCMVRTNRFYCGEFAAHTCFYIVPSTSSFFQTTFIYYTGHVCISSCCVTNSVGTKVGCQYTLTIYSCSNY